MQGNEGEREKEREIDGGGEEIWGEVYILFKGK